VKKQKSRLEISTTNTSTSTSITNPWENFIKKRKKKPTISSTTTTISNPWKNKEKADNEFNTKLGCKSSQVSWKLE
jgi:hypothetical protein